MINDFFVKQIKKHFLYQFTSEQEQIVDILVNFLLSKDSEVAFLLKGYAGTGKTSIIGALVKVLDELKQKIVLLAPTGRAAKVFSHHAGHTAYTIHKKIYRQRVFSNGMDNFFLNDNLHKHTLFLVDEASMISNNGCSGGGIFGSGCLLDDLVRYVYSGEGCRLLLIGDTAQLPPVSEDESPALSSLILEGYGLKVSECSLTQVVRQIDSSGILFNATRLRYKLTTEDFLDFPKFRLIGFSDICRMPGNELIEALSTSYSHVGMDETMVICRSNKRANLYNKGIRDTILYREEELSSGDWLMIAKNNYHWTEDNKEVDFIANGDIAVVRRVHRTREMYGFRFADVTISFPDYSDWELDATILLDTLHSDYPALSKEQNDRLFTTILEDYVDLPRKIDRMKKMKADSHYNALQVKYAYAVTCHKAQGGQWKHIYLDQGYVTEEMLTPNYFKWLYTAITRATEKLYLVNWPKEQIE